MSFDPEKNYVAELEAAIASIRAMDIVPDFTIEDYPSGRHRVLCKLEIEEGRQGYRTVRTTQDKHGRWCKPKKSTYGKWPKFVVVGQDMKHDGAWLTIGPHGIFLTYANGENEVMVEAPCTFGPPRRQDKNYTITVNGESLRKTLYADAPELIAAWDAWMEVFSPFYSEMLGRWKATYRAGVAV